MYNALLPLGVKRAAPSPPLISLSLSSHRRSSILIYAKHGVSGARRRGCWLILLSHLPQAPNITVEERIADPAMLHVTPGEALPVLQGDILILFNTNARGVSEICPECSPHQRWCTPCRVRNSQSKASVYGGPASSAISS